MSNHQYVFPGYDCIADALTCNPPLLQNDNSKLHRIYLGPPAFDAIVAALRFCEASKAPAPNEMIASLTRKTQENLV